MDAKDLRARLALRLPEGVAEALMDELLQLSKEAVCAYTKRDALPDALIGAQLELACVLYNRMGMEGESAHSEGNLSRSAESLPEYLRCQMNPFRLAKGVDA